MDKIIAMDEEEVDDIIAMMKRRQEVVPKNIDCRKETWDCALGITLRSESSSNKRFTSNLQ